MAVESHDKKLDDLLRMVEDGKAQLPDFQRSWVWDDTKICKLMRVSYQVFLWGPLCFWRMVVIMSPALSQALPQVCHKLEGDRLKVKHEF